MQSKVKLLLQLLLLVGVSYAFHVGLYQFTSLGQTAASFQFSLLQLYLFFGVSAFILLGILTFLPQRFTDNLGFVFIWLTLLKMALAYWFFYAVTASSATANTLEKRQVFVVFAWFLAIETYLSARILNNTQ
ncbi:MAG: hypothetical protein RL699_602 [Bacteroidota bacterium]|jgi:hypothetical protein